MIIRKALGFYKDTRLSHVVRNLQNNSFDLEQNPQLYQVMKTHWSHIHSKPFPILLPQQEPEIKYSPAAKSTPFVQKPLPIGLEWDFATDHRPIGAQIFLGPPEKSVQMRVATLNMLDSSTVHMITGANSKHKLKHSPGILANTKRREKETLEYVRSLRNAGTPLIDLQECSLNVLEQLIQEYGPQSILASGNRKLIQVILFDPRVLILQKVNIYDFNQIDPCKKIMTAQFAVINTPYQFLNINVHLPGGPKNTAAKADLASYIQAADHNTPIVLSGDMNGTSHSLMNYFQNAAACLTQGYPTHITAGGLSGDYDQIYILGPNIGGQLDDLSSVNGLNHKLQSLDTLLNRNKFEV